MFSWYCGLFHVTCEDVFVSVSTSVIIKTEEEVSHERKTTAFAIKRHQWFAVDHLNNSPFRDNPEMRLASDHVRKEKASKQTVEYFISPDATFYDFISISLPTFKIKLTHHNQFATMLTRWPDSDLTLGGAL